MGEANDYDAEYVLGYDEAERKRLRLQHDYIVSAMGKLVLAPIDLSREGLKILDSGTFDGYWLYKVAEIANKPQLVGADISPKAFPTSRTDSPESPRFHVQSVTDPWPQAWNGTFDLVHQRLVLAGTTPEGGRRAMRGLMELAKPGSGWVQIVEGTFAFLTDEQRALRPAQSKLQDLCIRMLPLMGWNPFIGPQVRSWLQEMGVEEMHENILDIPTGVGHPDPELGEIGKNNMLYVAQGFQEAAKALPADSSIAPEDFDGIVEGMKTEAETIGGFMKVYVIWARRS